MGREVQGASSASLGRQASPAGVRHELLAGSLACMSSVHLPPQTVFCSQLYLLAADPVHSPAGGGD